METDQILAAGGSIDSSSQPGARANYGSLNEGHDATIVAGGVPAWPSVPEQVPLLSQQQIPSPGAEDDAVEPPAWPGEADFAHLPWHKRPSVSCVTCQSTCIDS